MHVPPELVPRPPCTQRAPQGSPLGSFLLSSSLMPCSPTRKMQTAGAHWAEQGSHPRLGAPAALAPRRRALGRRLALPVTIITQN